MKTVTHKQVEDFIMNASTLREFVTLKLFIGVFSNIVYLFLLSP
jgi:hypothetical protein